MKWFFNEIHHSLSGKDGRLSIRRVLGLMFSIGFIHLSLLHIFKCRSVQEAFIWAYVALILGMFGITTTQNIMDKINGKKNEEV
jgi:hypothetical protein